jgi:hypothetical protein
MPECFKKYNKTEKDKLNKYIRILYGDLLKSYKYIEKLGHESNIELNINTINHKVNYSSEYFPKNILNYINSTTHILFSYKAKIHGKNIHLKFFDNANHPKYNKNTLTEYATIVFMTFSFLNSFASKKCSKNLHISIFLTPFKKKLPTNPRDIIGANNVNTGLSSAGCNATSKIVIYRDEEWFKVLIHELFHNLDLDFSTMNISKIQRKLLYKFEIQSEYNIYETYCEIWARILNVAIKSFLKTDSREKFIQEFHLLINKERIFSLMQANKIIKKFKKPEEYRESSNVFCYYILTAALINNLVEFFLWTNNNDNMIKFKKTEKNLEFFVELLLEQINSEEFEKNLECVSKLKNNDSLKMTII